MRSLQFRSVNKVHGVFKRNSWLKTVLHQNVNMATKLTATKRQSYTVSEQPRIVNFAERNENRAAEREFGVSDSNFRLWRSSKENLENMPRLKRANRGKTAWTGTRSAVLDYGETKQRPCLFAVASEAENPWTCRAQEIPDSRRAFQGWKSLVPKLHEKEWSVTSTENNPGSASPRWLCPWWSSSEKHCLRRITSTASLFLHRKKAEWMQTNWRSGSRKYGVRDSVAWGGGDACLFMTCLRVTWQKAWKRRLRERTRLLLLILAD